mgnify:CR=1 FL=1
MAERVTGKVAVVIGGGQQPGETIGNGRATAIVLAHNHPSGTLKPSQDDIKITTKVKKAANSLDIRVLDHLIVTEKSYFSFADEALIQ